MRDIEFRGKCNDPDNEKYGEWVTGDLFHLCGDVYIQACYPPDVYLYKVDSESVGQFTGKYDRTQWGDLTEQMREQWTRSGKLPSEYQGQKIFENDIILTERLIEPVRGAGTYWVKKRLVVEYSDQRFYPEHLHQGKVVGNTTDNGEMLEEKVS